jgi:hypothetical protein
MFILWFPFQPYRRNYLRHKVSSSKTAMHWPVCQLTRRQLGPQWQLHPYALFRYLERKHGLDSSVTAAT